MQAPQSLFCLFIHPGSGICIVEEGCPPLFLIPTAHPFFHGATKETQEGFEAEQKLPLPSVGCSRKERGWGKGCPCGQTKKKEEKTDLCAWDEGRVSELDAAVRMIFPWDEGCFQGSRAMGIFSMEAFFSLLERERIHIVQQDFSR